MTGWNRIEQYLAQASGAEQEARLWCAVLVRLLSDLSIESVRVEAAAALESDTFPSLCSAAGFEVGPLRDLGRRVLRGEQPRWESLTTLGRHENGEDEACE